MPKQQMSDMPHRDAVSPVKARLVPPTEPKMTLQQVMDRLGPSIFAGLLDTNGVVRYANQAALRAIDRTQAQVVGQRFDATPWWNACELSQQRLQQALADALRGEASRFDVRVATSNGATLDMDFSLFPLYGADGQVVWLIPSARDVTERESAHDQLRLTRHAVEQSNDALMQIGPDGVFRDVNAAACRLLGMERQLLLRMRVTDIDAQFDASQWPQRWSELCELGSLRFETNVLHREGHEIPVDVSVSLVTSDKASFAHVCMDDLSERRAAEHQIRQQTEELRRTVEALHGEIAERQRAEAALTAHRDNLEDLVRERTGQLRAAKEVAEADNEAKSSFLACISHELRTPLNVILGFAQVLKARDGMDERQQRAVELIDSSGKHLLALVNDLMDLSKISAGRFDILPSEFDPENFFGSIIEMARMRTEQKTNLEFVCDLPARWPLSICADQTRLRQVLMNLLDNAIKFTRRGQVTLRVRFRAPSVLCMEVEDTGIAMTGEQLARLFRPFEQLGDAQQRAVGTGLGLVISQRLARLMGSEIRVESRPPEGNLFGFDLEVGTPPTSSSDLIQAPIATSGTSIQSASTVTILRLRTASLRAGQTLIEDFKSPEGVLLLSAGQRLNDDLIDRIRAFERKHRLMLTFALTPPSEESSEASADSKTRERTNSSW
ncbi:PAS domain-containing sensor histidine kinase [Variovorax sp. VNK109]|uniref:PAS domain-containing sensor histidine kinase n=1 Tax=Variovorax sp. VNK109 TaxID=3400919 RepID=UPI003C02F576